MGSQRAAARAPGRQAQMPVFINNDANAAALAERYFDAAQDVEDFAYVVGDIGLGVGLVWRADLRRRQRLYREAGHDIDPNGPLLRCRRSRGLANGSQPDEP